MLKLVEMLKLFHNTETIGTTFHICCNERCNGRKKEASKAKQHSSPKAVTFPKKSELPRVGLNPTTLTYMYMDSSSLRHSCSVTVCAPVQETGLLVRLCFAEETKPPPHQTTADWRKYIQSVDEEDFCSSEQLLLCTCIYM